jgi:hypothetical protein
MSHQPAKAEKQHNLADSHFFNLAALDDKGTVWPNRWEHAGAGCT